MKPLLIIVMLSGAFASLAQSAKEQTQIEIGNPAVQPLIKKLQTTDEQEGGLRYQIILMLGK